MSKNKALDIVLSEFLELAKVPRPSHHEERVSEYLFQWAKSHGLAVEKDNMNEIIIDKPASPGCENVPRVIFQAHMDMVCVCEEGVIYDPMTDPIKVINDGVTLTADGTSLGADDGIGVAMCLYLLQDDTLRHGPIRAIFTTKEEDGMDSIAIDPKYLDGGYLVNLDWETLGSLCNSCAGGDFFNYKNLSVSVMPTSQIDAETAAIYSLREEEISPDTWLVEISVSYKYEGILSPVGPSNGEWIDILYQASPIGFLMTKDGNSYSLQSRYS